MLHILYVYVISHVWRSMYIYMYTYTVCTVQHTSCEMYIYSTYICTCSCTSFSSKIQLFVYRTFGSESETHAIGEYGRSGINVVITLVQCVPITIDNYLKGYNESLNLINHLVIVQCVHT